MKVLHLSTHDLRGGAGHAAWRLHRGMRDIGVESRMLVRTKHSTGDEVTAADDGSVAVWHEQILTPWLRRRLPQDAPWFTSGAITQQIAGHPWVHAADTLHLHWVAEWLDAATIAELAALGKPVFWTLHDLWPLACGCHYAGSDTPRSDAWQTGADLPSELREIGSREFGRKLQHLTPVDFRIIAPSRWIARMARQSIVGSSWTTEVVPYGIDTAVFSPSSALESRARWGLPQNKILLLFGCADLEEPRKGFPLLVEALQSGVLDAERVALVLFGKAQTKFPSLSIPAHHVGFVADEPAIASLFAAADACVFPALEDNLPNVVLEALACGAPVIGFETGGVADLVRDEENGLLAPCGDVPALTACLGRFAADGVLRRKLQACARGDDMSRYAQQTQAQRCLALYQQALGTDEPVGCGQFESPAAVAKWRAQPSLLASEIDWAFRAAAESVNVSVAREAEFCKELEQKKTKIEEISQQATRWKSEARSARASLDLLRRKPWRAWFKRTTTSPAEDQD